MGVLTEGTGFESRRLWRDSLEGLLVILTGGSGFES